LAATQQLENLPRGFFVPMAYEPPGAIFSEAYTWEELFRDGVDETIARHGSAVLLETCGFILRG
jgi:hypothetical protein